MPNSYLIAKVTNFNEKILITPNKQLGFLDEDGLNMTEGEGTTRMNYIEDFEVEGYSIQKYHVKMDYKVNKRGKVFDRFFNFYYQPNEFEMFYVKSENILFVRTQKDVAKEFLKQLNLHQPNLEYKILEIELKTILNKIEKIKSAWIKVSKDGINVESYHGNQVNNDQVVRKAIQNNTANYINFIYEFNDHEIYCGISKKGNINLYEDQLVEHNKLVLLFKIYTHLLK
ncbi:hypothetical protein ACV7JQ_07215 [Globicatella sulfidifaciens]